MHCFCPLPALFVCRFTENPGAATTVQGFAGSLGFQNAFYDNVFGQRRGVTSLVWAKPKLKFKTKDFV